MQSLSNTDIEGKVCLTRVDFNSPLDDNKNLLDITRIKAHAETIKYIADHNGKVVVIAHQGRPGSSDFCKLNFHAKELQQILGAEYSVSYLGFTHGPEVETRIKALNAGDILVLENVRMAENETMNKPAEEHAKDPYIQSLTKVGDIFVNDAFSAAHRSHMSLVGFTTLLPAIPGLIMEREITNLQRVVDNPEKPCTFILGGIKPDDSFKVAEYVLSNTIADSVLTGGVVSQLLLIASGKSLGKPTMEFLEKKNLLQFIKLAEKLLSNFKEQIKTQVDFAVNKEGRRNFSLNDLPLHTSILDIGDRTIEKYVQVIRNSSTVVYNGPMGKIEDKLFEKGTLEIFKAMGNSKGFSLAGGGHSISIIEKYGINLSYISTAGKAMIQFLMGKTLPAIKSLKSIES